MGRTIGILLAISLAANVFLGGFVAGRVAGPNLPGFDHGRDKDGRGHEGRGGHRGGHPDFDGLSPAAREKLKASFQKNREEIAGAFREGRALRDEFIGILTAETFDRAAAEAAAAKLEAFDEKRRGSMPRLVIEVMDGLSAEDRRAVAELVERRMMEEMAGPGKRRRGRRGEGPPPPPPEDDPGTE